MYSKPARVIAAPSALTNNSGTGTAPRTANQARRSAAVAFQSGRHRSLRPLPRIRVLGVGCRDKCSSGSPTSSETRRPPAKQRCIIARSRIPSLVVRSGALCQSSSENHPLISVETPPLSACCLSKRHQRRRCRIDLLDYVVGDGSPILGLSRPAFSFSLSRKLSPLMLTVIE